MIWQLYLFLAAMAFVLSAVSFRERLAVDAQIGAAGLGFLLWTMWGLTSYNVETITDSGDSVVHQYEAMVIVGLIIAAMMLVWAAYNVMRMFGLDPERLWGFRI